MNKVYLKVNIHFHVRYISESTYKTSNLIALQNVYNEKKRWLEKSKCFIKRLCPILLYMLKPTTLKLSCFFEKDLLISTHV